MKKKVYASETEGSRRRGRPVVRRKDKVKEYMHERVSDGGERLNKQGVRVWIGGESFCAIAIPLGVFPKGMKHQRPWQMPEHMKFTMNIIN